MIDLKKTMRDIATFSAKQKRLQQKKLQHEVGPGRRSLKEAFIVAYSKVIESLDKMLSSHKEKEEKIINKE